MFNLPIIALAMAALAIFVSAVWSPANEPVTHQQSQDIHQLAQYRAFAYVTALYLNDNKTFTGTLTWADLKTAPTTPDGMRNAEVNGSFKAVVTTATDYVICGELPEGAATALNQFMPDTDQAKRTSGGQMVFARTLAEAEVFAAKCGS